MKIKKTRNLYLMFCKAKKSQRNQCFTTKPTRELRNRCFSHLNDSSCVYLCVFSICVFAQVLRNNRSLLQIQVWRPVVRYPQTTKMFDFDTKLITRSYFQKIDAGGRRQDTIREETHSRENGFGRKASRGYGIRGRRGRTHADTKINHFIL